MQIHQMSVTYLPEQDRILMRINTVEGEEMRKWRTRRLMVGLWPLLSKLLTEHLLKLESAGASLSGANPELKKMLADFRKEEFLQHADFDTPYKEGQQRLPLGEEPLLVTDVDASPLANGPLRLNFNERPPQCSRTPARSSPSRRRRSACSRCCRRIPGWASRAWRARSGSTR